MFFGEYEISNFIPIIDKVALKKNRVKDQYLSCITYHTLEKTMKKYILNRKMKNKQISRVLRSLSRLGRGCFSIIFF